VSRAELAAEIGRLFGRDAGAAVRYGAKHDPRHRYQQRKPEIPESAWHPATQLTRTHRGTSNTNDRGSAEDRRRRKQYLLDTWGDGYTTRCAFDGCGVELNWDTLTVDRFPKPGRLGGRYTRDNIRPACGPHNFGDQGHAGMQAMAEAVAAAVDPRPAAMADLAL
jgi:hypothetical protein